MGYYHSWKGPRDPEAFCLIRADFEKLILPLADMGCPIAGPLGTGVPELTDNYIQFNGLRHCGHSRVEAPVVMFPANNARGIDADTGELFRAAFLGVVNTRRCDGQCCHDDFWLGNQYDGGFCKTAFKPYDVAVAAALLIAKHHWGESFEITSCGSDAQWLDAKLLCQRVLGYGSSFRFVRRWRPPRPSALGSEMVEAVFLEES